MQYLNFRLKIQKTSILKYKVELLESPTTNCAIEQNSPDFLPRVNSFLSKLEQRTIQKYQLEQLGKLLFDFLFYCQIRDAYLASRALAEAQGKGLRIRLQIEPAELAYLPWELLYDPQTEIFLATSPTTLLTRCPVNRTDVSRTLGVALRILIIAPSPLENDEELDVKTEIRLIRDTLKSLKRQNIQIDFKVLDGQVDFSSIQLELGMDYSIVHYIGHGDFINEIPYLRLRDDFTGQNFLDGRKLVKLLEGSPGLQLVLLNSCNGARESSNKALRGLASQLAETGIPAVIANRNPVRDDFAVLFARIFYGFLGRGFPIDFALNRARLRLLIETDEPACDFSNPVGYMVKQNGMLFQLEQFQVLNQFYDKFVSVQQKIMKIVSARHFQVFGFRIFSVVNEQEQAYLGAPKAKTVFRSKHSPFCTAVVKAPALVWPADSSVREFKLNLIEYNENSVGRVIWKSTIKSNRFDLSHQDLNLQSETVYGWNLAYRYENQNKFYNGLFWLLSENELNEYHKLKQTILKEFEIEFEREIALCTLYFSFGFYDLLIDFSNQLLSKYQGAPNRIPVYKCIIETMSELNRRFSKAKMGPAADEIIDYRAFYKSQLDQINQIPG